ncbi:MAG: TspO/MBR family protein [Candidatus Woesearchaeota archaeon]|jgi:tryptophan-rich sensory protein
MKIKNLKLLIISLLIPQLAGGLGALFTTPMIPTWYSTLIKPSFNPPSWIFGPVWTTLFLLMGYSLYLILLSKSKDKNKAIVIFTIQLALNVFWSILFFGQQCPKCAFIEVIALWISIVATIIAFRKISKTAAYLLIPYLFWVSFAAILNYYLMILN